MEFNMILPFFNWINPEADMDIDDRMHEAGFDYRLFYLGDQDDEMLEGIEDAANSNEMADVWIDLLGDEGMPTGFSWAGLYENEDGRYALMVKPRHALAYKLLQLTREYLIFNQNSEGLSA